jgi:Ca2+-binding EF-hand superfamily protein
MLTRLLMSLTLVMGASALLAPAAVADTMVDAALMKTLDPDADGTVDLAEAKAAAAAMFKKLNTDDDDTLSMKELAGRISEADFKAADPDGDGTLDMAEYTALVEKLFKEANPDGDGTLDETELKSAAGQKLLSLIA